MSAESDLILTTLLDIKEAIGELKAQQLAANVVLQRHFDDDTSYQEKINAQLGKIETAQSTNAGKVAAYAKIATVAGAAAGIVAGALSNLIRWTHL